MRQPESDLLKQLKEQTEKFELYKKVVIGQAKEIGKLSDEIKSQNITIQLIEQENRELLKSLDELKK